MPQCLMCGNKIFFLVIEIQADTTVADAVKVLSECNILSAPVINPDAATSMNWRERYLGIIDYSAIVLWVLETAEVAAVALSASTATAVGLGAGAVGALGALAVGVTGPAAVAGLTVAAVGAAVAGGVAADQASGGDAPAAADNLGKEFYKVILQEEPFKSTTVSLVQCCLYIQRVGCTLPYIQFYWLRRSSRPSLFIFKSLVFFHYK